MKELTFSNDGDVSGNHGGGDVWVVKINAIGKIIWQRAVGGSGYETGLPMKLQKQPMAMW